ncbi:MAG: DNA polymerase III subunit beta [Synergistaceae bacterium]|jgi:DNA polymerase-3 subunit beta|nr:DNA polymerase III subunit beta [Synergistaceae bacterium]
MKIDIVRPEFMKAWQMAERSSSSKSTFASLGGILVTVEGDRVVLEATDLKTSIRCTAGGVSASQNESAIFPVKLLGELFRKAPVDLLKVDIKEEKGVLSAGRSRTRFSTWPVSDFPKLPRCEGANPLCDVSAGELSRALSEGSIASSLTDDFPKYLGACLLQVQGGSLQIVSTDGRRLSLSKCLCDAQDEAELLLPLAALRELQRLLGAGAADASVKILYDGSLAWFRLGEVEFSVRRVESSFPSYKRILEPGSTTTAILRRDTLLSALDRVDIIVRSYTRMVVMQFSPGGQVKLTGRAPDFGTAVEFMDATIDGEPMRAGFNVAFLQDGLKSLGADDVRMNLNGSAGQMTLFREGSDDFLYMLMPMKVIDQDLLDPEDERDEIDADAEENAKQENAKQEDVKQDGGDRPSDSGAVRPDEVLNDLVELKKEVEKTPEPEAAKPKTPRSRAVKPDTGESEITKPETADSGTKEAEKEAEDSNDRLPF